MKCPLTFSKTGTYDEIKYQVDCYKQECAWWNDDANVCAVLQLSRDIYRMEDRIACHMRKE